MGEAPDLLSAPSPPPASAPLLVATPAPPPRPPARPPPASPAPAAGLPAPVRAAYRRVLRELSSLPRAIAIMAAVATLSGLGTIIPQNKGAQFYAENYPAGEKAVLGFLSSDVLLASGLDHVYSASYFYALLGLLAASLAACTATTQWPAARVAQRWRFARDADDLARLADGGAAAVAVLPAARLRDLARALRGSPAAPGAGGGGASSARAWDGGYQTFVSPDGTRLYAFKGLAGRLGPIGVHAALLLTLFGTAYSGFGGWRGTAMVPEGQAFVVADRLVPMSAISRMPPRAPGTALYVNGFEIDTRPDGSVAQFYSDLSLREATPVAVRPKGGGGGGDGAGNGQDQQQSGRGGSGSRGGGSSDKKGYALGDRVLLRKRISVNDPFRYGGVTMYQTDWSLVSLQLRMLPVPAAAADGGAIAGAEGEGSSGSRAGASAVAAAAEAAGDGEAAAAAQEGRAFSLPLASLEGKPGVPEGSKIWATYLPLEALPPPGSPAPAKPPRGVSIIAKDPSLATFYDSKGAFAGVRRAGSGKPIDVEGVRLVLERVVPATGLELKSDPGVPYVYAGFGGLMVTTLVSYVSHSQVWAVQRGRDVLVGGRSNRAKVGFAQALAEVADRVPEVLDAGDLAALDALGAAKEAGKGARGREKEEEEQDDDGGWAGAAAGAARR